MGNVTRNTWKFHNANSDIYNDPDMYFDGEWDYFNDPLSAKFQTLEYALGTYRYKHQVFLEYFPGLKIMATQLIQEIQKELDSRN